MQAGRPAGHGRKEDARRRTHGVSSTKKRLAELEISFRSDLVLLRLLGSETPCDDAQGRAVLSPNDRQVDVQVLLAKFHHKLQEFATFLTFTADQ